MSGPSSTAVGETSQKASSKWSLVSIAVVIVILLAFLISKVFQPDPFVETTMNLEGSLENGVRLFRMNCAGCHGINGQGLVGPSLQAISTRHRDTEIINQIVKGLTPPMPRFQMEPQEMADLLAYLNSLK